MPKSKVSKKPKIKLTQETTKSQNIKPAKSSKSSSSSSSKSSNSAKKAPRESLAPIRAQLEVLTAQANERVNALVKSGLPSRALMEAQRTMSAHNKREDQVFTSNQPRKRDLEREFARVQAFLTDYTSVVEGAKDFTGALTHGLFGAQWRANGGGGYDPNRVTAEQADAVFEIYHEVLSREGGWERVMSYFRASSNGLVEYGSENLINAIFDMVKNQPFEALTKRTRQDIIDDAVNKTADFVDTIIETYDRMKDAQLLGLDAGQLGIDPDFERRQKHWQWKLERERLAREGKELRE